VTSNNLEIGKIYKMGPVVGRLSFWLLMKVMMIVKESEDLNRYHFHVLAHHNAGLALWDFTLGTRSLDNNYRIVECVSREDLPLYLNDNPTEAMVQELKKGEE